MPLRRVLSFLALILLACPAVAGAAPAWRSSLLRSFGSTRSRYTSRGTLSRARDWRQCSTGQGPAARSAGPRHALPGPRPGLLRAPARHPPPDRPPMSASSAPSASKSPSSASPNPTRQARHQPPDPYRTRRPSRHHHGQGPLTAARPANLPFPGQKVERPHLPDRPAQDLTCVLNARANSPLAGR